MLSTVLIIDKRKELSTKYKKCIDSAEVNSTITRTLKDAIVAIRDLEPDMIIVSDSINEDLASFCQKIRALTFNTRPIIVALSKSAETQDRIEVLESGADDFWSEPVNIDEFKTRIMAHLRREVESDLDSKTLLPNKNYIRKVLKRVLAVQNQAVLLAGIENLESYKSIYTELAADKIIQTFVAIVKSALDENDFIGQYDETNFVIVTNKYSAERLAEFIPFAFDTVAPKFYSEKDAKRGYMQMKGEKYAGMRVNFVSVLVGGVLEISEDLGINNSVNNLIDKLFSIKKLAKLPSGSNYVIERTKLTASDSVKEEVFNRNVYIKESDESLSYLLRTSLELQGYDVLNDFQFKEESVPSVIIYDSKDDLSGLDFVKGIKSERKYANTKIIVTTTVHNKSVVLDAGADLYLPKPYEISDLITWVEYFFKG